MDPVKISVIQTNTGSQYVMNRPPRDTRGLNQPGAGGVERKSGAGRRDHGWHRGRRWNAQGAVGHEARTALGSGEWRLAGG